MWDFNLCLERPKIKDPFCHEGSVYTPMIYGNPKYATVENLLKERKV